MTLPAVSLHRNRERRLDGVHVDRHGPVAEEGRGLLHGDRARLLPAGEPDLAELSTNAEERTLNKDVQAARKMIPANTGRNERSMGDSWTAEASRTILQALLRGSDQGLTRV